MWHPILYYDKWSGDINIVECKKCIKLFKKQVSISIIRRNNQKDNNLKYCRECAKVQDLERRKRIYTTKKNTNSPNTNLL